MLRKLQPADYYDTMDLLLENPSLNLLQIGDIQNYGFDSEIQDLWGEFDEEGTLIGVLLRYRNNYIPYFKDINRSYPHVCALIKSDSQAKIISGENEQVELFESTFLDYTKKDMYFCELKNANQLAPVSIEVKRATLEDSIRLYEFLSMIEPCSLMGTYYSIASIEDKIRTHSGRLYYIENENQEIICTVQTSAENFTSAMIMSVATREDYRQQGLMTQALSKLCEDLLAEGKTLCLFYDNEEAGSVYHKLGFETIAKWSMLVRD